MFKRTYYDPTIQESALTEINNRKENIAKDSLIKRIESAPMAVPEDISSKTLIVETYNYVDYLHIGDHKFYEWPDTKRNRLRFDKYLSKKTTLLKGYGGKTLYLDKGHYDTLDTNEFRYVLKTTTRLVYDHVTVSMDGNIGPWVSYLLYYIEDRRSGKVFGGIRDLSILTKNPLSKRAD